MTGADAEKISNLKGVEMEANTQQIKLQRGMKVINLYGTIGWVTRFTPGAAPVEYLGAGVVVTGGGQVDIVYENLTTGRVSEGIVIKRPWQVLDGAEDLKSEQELAELEELAADKLAQDTRDREEEGAQRQAAIDQGQALIEEKVPDWAKAVIVAHHEVNDCDSMTDYFNTKSGPMYLLAWSKHTRDIFSEMRKAAAVMTETAHMATAPDEDDNGDKRTDANKSWWHPRDEHREKYSMGAGYYLKDGGTYSTGWKIKKIALGKWSRDDIYYAAGCGRCRIPDPGKAQSARPAPLDGVTVTENEEKDGVEIRFPGKPPADIREALKANGFRWSRFSGCWYKRRCPESLAYARSLAA